VKKDILRLGTVLALYAAAACVALAFVYTVTQPTIAGLEEAQLQASLKDLFPDADSFESADGSIVSKDAAVVIKTSYKAVKSGAIVGIASKALGKSYGGVASMLIGVSADGKIVGARVLTLADTPGLGANAVNPAYFVDKSKKTTFAGQFTGKPVSDPFEVKKDVIAISASTITSKALTAIVKQAGLAGREWLKANAAGGSK
jgi:Na+-translocating ferredoxin:NAD+ oxidoreductase subunit G